MAEDKVDPLKIISLSRDLFFSFVPGFLSCAGRSPAAQAVGPRPGYRHLCKTTDIDSGAGESRDLQSERHWHQRIQVHNKSSFICRALKRSTCVYVRGSELDRGGFWPGFKKGAEIGHLYLVRFKPPCRACLSCDHEGLCSKGNFGSIHSASVLALECFLFS